MSTVIPIPTEHMRKHVRKQRRKAREKRQHASMVALVDRLRIEHKMPDADFLDFVNAGHITLLGSRAEWKRRKKAGTLR